MPQFSYQAKQGPLKVIDGFIEAESLDVAVRKILQQGLVPLDVNLTTSRDLEKSFFKKSRGAFKGHFYLVKRVGLNDVVLFTRQMSDLVEASIPILRCLQITIGQMRNPQLKKIIEGMFIFVRDGGSFSDALAQHPDIFSGLYVNMIKTGEISGQLELVMRRLAEYLEKEQETKGKVQSSLAYPAFILIVGIISIFILFSFVIPRLTVMFDDMDQSLPLPTRVLMSISGFFAKFWWLIAGLSGIGAVYFKQWTHSAKGKMALDQWQLKLPLLGDFIRTVEVGRFARTLGTLVESGVVIPTALKAVSTTIENAILRDELKKVSDDVTSGSSLKNALKKCTFFPELAVNMISIGEETGRLERGLFKIAETYERQADQTVKTLLSLLGPMVLVVIVGLVGFVVIAMLLPIFKMNMLIK